MKDIKIVIGANFGDEGKGKLTDYYTKNADNCIVVCSNGGAQRGHTVLKSDGTRHVFHHFGSGTLNGADTYLPEDFILNPLVFREEWEELKKLGFAANNIVFGVGAFCFSAVIEPDGHMVVVTRDMFGIAMKATYGIVNGEPIMIYKDPKTDTSHLKKSHKGCCCIYYDDNGELQCEDGYDSIFGNGTLRTVFVDGEACNKETFEDIRERLNGGNKKTKISKITDYLLKDDVIVVMDVDGVLAPYEFFELSHSMTDDEWDRLVASGENPYKDVRPIKLMQKFIQKKGIDKVYTCSKSPSSEIPGKRAFIKNNYNLPDDNIYFTLEKTEKLTVLQTLQQKLGLKPSQIAIVEDTVKTLDYIRAHSDFVTVHVSSFME